MVRVAQFQPAVSKAKTKKSGEKSKKMSALLTNDSLGMAIYGAAKCTKRHSGQKEEEEIRREEKKKKLLALRTMILVCGGNICIFFGVRPKTPRRSNNFRVSLFRHHLLLAPALFLCLSLDRPIETRNPGHFPTNCLQSNIVIIFLTNPNGNSI